MEIRHKNGTSSLYSRFEKGSIVAEYINSISITEILRLADEGIKLEINNGYITGAEME